MVRDLQEVDVREAVRKKRWVDALFDVAHQEDATRPDLTEKDDRDVVDPSPTIGRRDRHLARDRPQHAK